MAHKKIHREFYEMPLSPEEREELRGYIKQFKPVFGNPDHAEIGREIGELLKMIKDQEDRIERYREIRKTGKKTYGAKMLDKYSIKICTRQHRLHFKLKKLYGTKTESEETSA